MTPGGAHPHGHGDHHGHHGHRGHHGPQGGHRPAQVSSLIARTVQMEILRGLSDPRVRGMVTVLGVELSQDLEDATVRVSVLPGEFGALTVQALNHAAGHFRKTLLEETRMRHAPRVRFALDESLKRAAAVDSALREAAEQSGAEHPDTEIHRED